VATTEAQELPARRAREGRWPPAWEQRASSISLLWRVFMVNAVIWLVAVALLAWTPVTVHRVATPRELVVLAVGLALVLVVDLLLLRRVLGPVRRLATVMGAVKPEQPGRRAEPPASGGPEVAALAEALNSMLDRLEDERRESGRRALAAQESERARIARELHDEVGQSLTAVALRAERAADQPDAQTRALVEIAETVLRSLQDVQRIGRELRPEALDDLGLINALIAMCSRVARQSGIRLERNLDAQLPPLTDEVELVIYRVAQEALTNAVRHSGGTEVSISLRPSDDRVTLTVTDDGRGLPASRREGGLVGMRERAMLIGAEFRVSSRPGRGTEVRLDIPLDGRW
jgi:two-component system, NarL family, sensor histidine kinase UhpB